MSHMISVRLLDHQAKALDDAVRAGRFANRTAALRSIVDRFAREERDRALADEFRRAYSIPLTSDERDARDFLDDAATDLLFGER